MEQIAIHEQGRKVIVSIPFRIKAIAITFRQNTGQNIPHLRQLALDAIF